MNKYEDSPYRLPKVEEVSVTSFDLYRQNPNVSVSVNRNIFCLIGANGLGKSTFLNTLLYGLTGGLPYRSRAFSSPREYAEEATRLDRREDYYGGRLSEGSAEHAAVSVILRWPNITAKIERQIFGPGAVRSLVVTRVEDKEFELFEEGDADRVYKELVVKESLLPDFNQFVFLLHYVCAFDEDRHLLLWDPGALTNALYLAFGSDAEQAEKANKLKREVERLGSRARNSAFAAKQSRDEADRLEKALKGSEDEQGVDASVVLSYEKLNERLDDANDRVARKQAELHKAEAIVSDRSAALTELQLEYDEAFSRRAAGAPITHYHPLIRATVTNDKCTICAADGVANLVLKQLDENVCPLCKSDVTNTVDDQELIQVLKGLDNRIENAREELKKGLDRRRRLRDEYEAALQSVTAARGARDDFLQSNPGVYSSARSKGEPSQVNSAIERQRSEAERFTLQSKREYADRDKARSSLNKIERELQAQFDRNSTQFTALFRNYAEQFIGLSVDIELEHRRGVNQTGFELLLSLEDQSRTRADDVSESQRFFLDIALRMALAEFMSSTSATLLIDTPEGSLDITYEARAGVMFSNFAKRENSILMTANLRSSALLHRLAKLQKKDGMQIERMTDWTELSDVQREEEALFTAAYEEIEKALV